MKKKEGTQWRSDRLKEEIRSILLLNDEEKIEIYKERKGKKKSNENRASGTTKRQKQIRI